jgi:hypothetical protein
MKVLIILISSILFFGCKTKEVNNVYKNRNYLMNLCKNKVLLKSRGNNFILFKTIKNDSVNKYYIDIDSIGNYDLHRDTIQYSPDIIKLTSERNSEDYKTEICDYVKILDKKLKKFGINGFTTEFSSLGEPFNFYMNDGKRIIYMPDKANSLDNDEYQKSLKKIDENWYYDN